jgi:hypothetical protein
MNSLPRFLKFARYHYIWYLALNGAPSTVNRLRKIIVEIHGDNFEQVKQILENYNFKLEIVRTGEQINYVIGSK